MPRGFQERRAGEPRARRRCGRPRFLVAIVLSCVVAGCATSGSDIHLAPFYTRLNTGDEGVQTELFGGLYRQRNRLSDGFMEEATMWAFWGIDRKDTGEYISYFLFPLGLSASTRSESRSFLIPVYTSARQLRSDGTYKSTLITLPGFIFRSDDRTGSDFGWFPFYANLDDFLSYDKLLFAPWPIFIRNERKGVVNHHVIWPFIGWTGGGGSSGFHVWPLYGQLALEGKYERTYFLWPFIHFGQNKLDREEPETYWVVWPLLGQKKQGTYRATTFIWPFFGYSRDPETGFWALDFPWPLVRIQRGPDVQRTRVWPFFSHVSADGLETTSFLWPIFQFRHEENYASIRDSTYVVPFWQSWERRDKLGGETETWKRFFPFFEHGRHGDLDRGHFPALNIFPRSWRLGRFFARIWILYEWQNQGDVRRERTWLGMWRREKGMGEDRRSISALWSQRRYYVGLEEVCETSLLFGLLRWRVTEERGFDMLPVALPGPGWPPMGTIDPELATAP